MFMNIRDNGLNGHEQLKAPPHSAKKWKENELFKILRDWRVF